MKKMPGMAQYKGNMIGCCKSHDEFLPITVQYYFGVEIVLYCEIPRR